MLSERDLLIELPGFAYDSSLILSCYEDLSLDDARVYWSIWEEDGHLQTNSAPTGDNMAVHEIAFVGLDEDRRAGFRGHLRDLVGRFHPSLGIELKHVRITRFAPRFHFPPHRDPARWAAIMLPIYPAQPTPIAWHDEDGRILHEHTYGCATLINTAVLHSVATDDRARMNVQIQMGDLTFDECRALMEKGQFLVDQTLISAK